jgi:ribosome maturation factor RimP
MAFAKSELEKIIKPTVVDMGFEFWGLDYSNKSGSAFLRVFIESEKGINVEDCAEVSRRLSVLLDVENPIKGVYDLEISSPGMSRRFYSLDQYQRFIGAFIKVKLYLNFNGRKNFKGILVGVQNEELVIRDGDDEFFIPFESIDKGSMVPQFN